MDLVDQCRVLCYFQTLSNHNLRKSVNFSTCVVNALSQRRHYVYSLPRQIRSKQIQSKLMSNIIKKEFNNRYL